MADPADEGWRKRDNTGFMASLGPLWSRREEHAWAYGVLATDDHINRTGVVHGGMLVTLADQAMSMVAWEAMDRAPCVTIHLDTHFLSSARPGDFIQARARVVRRTRSLVFMHGSLEVEGEVVMAATGIWKVVAQRTGSSAPAG